MPQRFDFRYGSFRWLLSFLGMGPRFSRVVIDERDVRVQMGWAFRSVIPRAAITRASRHPAMRSAIGVHGWRGRWLVNGSAHGIATVDIEPRARAQVIGWPIRLRRLHVSLTEPDEFVAALASTPCAG